MAFSGCVLWFWRRLLVISFKIHVTSIPQKFWLANWGNRLSSHHLICINDFVFLVYLCPFRFGFSSYLIWWNLLMGRLMEFKDEDQILDSETDKTCLPKPSFVSLQNLDFILEFQQSFHQQISSICVNNRELIAYADDRLGRLDLGSSGICVLQTYHNALAFVYQFFWKGI